MFSDFRSLRCLLADRLGISQSLELCGQFLAMILPPYAKGMETLKRYSEAGGLCLLTPRRRGRALVRRGRWRRRGRRGGGPRGRRTRGRDWVGRRGGALGG